jgi:hypothetical protein
MVGSIMFCPGYILNDGKKVDVINEFTSAGARNLQQVFQTLTDEDTSNIQAQLEAELGTLLKAPVADNMEEE